MENGNANGNGNGNVARSLRKEVSAKLISILGPKKFILIECECTREEDCSCLYLLEATFPERPGFPNVTPRNAQGWIHPVFHLAHFLSYLVSSKPLNILLLDPQSN